MKLVPDSKKVLLKAWSVRLIAANGVLSGLQAVLPYIDKNFSVDPTYFAVTVFLVNGAAFAARFILQEAFK